MDQNTLMKSTYICNAIRRMPKSRIRVGTNN